MYQFSVQIYLNCFLVHCAARKTLSLKGLWGMVLCADLREVLTSLTTDHTQNRGKGKQMILILDVTDVKILKGGRGTC